MAECQNTRHEQKLPILLALLFILTLIMLAVFQSSALVTLSYDLPSNSTSELVIGLAEQWHEWMERMGTADLTQTVRDWVEAAHESPINE